MAKRTASPDKPRPRSAPARRSRGDTDPAQAKAPSDPGRFRAVEDALLEKALAGSVTAQVFWLCNRAPERWRHVQKVQVQGTVEQICLLADLVKLAALPPAEPQKGWPDHA
jgi:hypothetical protein